ncbi:hypothetical protein RJ55_02641 [Drechmeria coniospora]|nr:hypothetical protein RJ55_02641 [Drechmeria coniospora]
MMNHGSMGGGHGAKCKISMLWNWHTVDACFLSSSWHIRNEAMFAATCIGVVVLVVVVEFSRRLGKEYDRFLTRQFQREASRRRGDLDVGDGLGLDVGTFRASVLQQLLRSLLHAVTFAGAYMVMLLAMYFNGYVIISIFVGAGLGKFLCDCRRGGCYGAHVYSTERCTRCE